MLADTHTGATKTGTAVAILGLIGGLGVAVAAQLGRAVGALGLVDASVTRHG